MSSVTTCDDEGVRVRVRDGAGPPGVVPQPRPRPAPRPRARMHQLRGEAAVGAPQQPHVTPAQRPGHVAVPGQDTELGTA